MVKFSGLVDGIKTKVERPEASADYARISLPYAVAKQTETSAVSTQEGLKIVSTLFVSNDYQCTLEIIRNVFFCGL